MSLLAEDLNDNGHYVGLIYSLKQGLNLYVKVAQCQHWVAYFIHP